MSAVIARIVPARTSNSPGRARAVRDAGESRLYRELESGDARWRDRTRHLLEYLRCAPVRSHAELRHWAQATGFGMVETVEQLCWLSNEGLAAGSFRDGWRAA